jgi:hypothetical protein
VVSRAVAPTDTVVGFARGDGPNTGPAADISGADIPGLLANRINTPPRSPGVQELKEWMALLSYVMTGLGGSVTSQYASTSDFTQFASFGTAVQTASDYRAAHDHA